MPKEPVNARQTLMSIKTRTVDNQTSSAASESTAALESPPAYPENSSYAAFNTSSNPKEAMYLRAMEAVNAASPIAITPSQGQDSAFSVIPENPPISGASMEPTTSTVVASEVSSDQSLSSQVSLPLERQLLDQQSPTTSRKSSKKNSRVQEWYEQQIGRLMAKCENANKIAKTASQEIQVHREAAKRATSEIDALRPIVKSQKDRMDCLAIELACHRRRGDLIINNPDDDVKDMGRLGLPSYEESLGDHIDHSF